MPRNGQEPGDFLVVQWLRLGASTREGTGSVLHYRGWGTKTPHAVWHSQKVKITKKKLLQDKRGWKLRVKGRRMGPEVTEEDRRTAPRSLGGQGSQGLQQEASERSLLSFSQRASFKRELTASNCPGRPPSILFIVFFFVCIFFLNCEVRSIDIFI